MATEPPYPTAPADLPYRVAVLEKWREAIEKDQIPTMLAIMDERLQNAQKDIAVLKAQSEMLVRRDNERTGFLRGNKAIITVVGFFLLQLISVLVILSERL